MAFNSIATFLSLFIILVLFDIANAQYEDVRCKCICPSPEVVKGNKTERKLYIANVVPSQCKCEGVVMPQADEYLRAKEKEFCPRCECRYERRNTTTIFVVVIIIIWVISLLTVYMLFLMCLDPLLNKRRTAYQEHTNEEVTLVRSRYTECLVDFWNLETDHFLKQHKEDNICLMPNYHFVK